MVQDDNSLKNFQEHYAEVNGVRLHYVSSGEGDLILFLHGFPEFWVEWENQLIEFGRDYHAVAPDMRGYNLSSKPDDPAQYGVNHLTEDIRALVEHLGYTRFVLVAHDWGGAVAWFFANRYPDMLEKLIIINSPHAAVFARELLSNPEQQKASQYMLMFRSPEAERILSENDYAVLFDALQTGGSRWKMSEEEHRRYLEAWSQPGALTGGLNYYRVSPLYPPTSPDDENRIRGIANLSREFLSVKVPTLVIWGELDSALLIGNLDGLEDYVDKLTVKRIPDGSHWVVHEQPELVNRLMREFIES